MALELLVLHARPLLTLAGPARPRAGAQMRELGAIEDGAVLVRGGRVVETGTTADLRARHKGAEILDAGGRLVLPGFVDCHTHLVFAGSREDEMVMRLAGAAYLEILEKGGGIHRTVAATRAAPAEALERLALDRLRAMVRHGTTAVEIKSGYGLDLDTERRTLEVIARLPAKAGVDAAATYLGAHVPPWGEDRAAYVELVVRRALPALRGLAEFCDVFCEDGAFTREESGRILRAAKGLGYRLKVHAGQFSDLGAAGDAAALGAVSADHLEWVSPDQLEAMKGSGTIAVLMPGVPFFLGSERYPDARGIIGRGVPVALATDFNPGSCPSFSMQTAIALACLKMGMAPEEAVAAATINAAHAMGWGEVLGSLEPGKKADLVCLDASSPAAIPYHFGANLVRWVVKEGKVVEGPA